MHLSEERYQHSLNLFSEPAKSGCMGLSWLLPVQNDGYIQALNRDEHQTPKINTAGTPSVSVRQTDPEINRFHL